MRVKERKGLTIPSGSRKLFSGTTAVQTIRYKGELTAQQALDAGIMQTYCNCMKIMTIISVLGPDIVSSVEHQKLFVRKVKGKRLDS